LAQELQTCPTLSPSSRSIAIVAMAKTMIAVVFLGAVGAAQAVSNAQCAVDGLAAVDDLSDAAMFGWAASKRCGNPKDSQVKCEVDIASAAQSASNMIGTIAGAVAECGAVNTDAVCAAAVSDVTGAAAGLAAASGAIVNSCKSGLKIPNGLPDDGTDQMTTLGNCIFDAKGAFRTLFDASKSMSDAVKAKNAHDENTAVINVMEALSGMGSSLAASVSDCSSVNGNGNEKADCASAVLDLVSNLNGIALAGRGLKKGCGEGAARLYVEHEKTEEVGASSTSLQVALAAFLPMAAALSFAAGRYSRASVRSTVATDEETAMLAVE